MVVSEPEMEVVIVEREVIVEAGRVVVVVADVVKVTVTGGSVETIVVNDPEIEVVLVTVEAGRTVVDMLLN